jgi:8-oxo-dGTP diphosphatase
MQEKKHTIRVYGLYVNSHKQVLLTDEKVGDFYFTKFPGGGLEFGEGTHDCLIREFKEELNLDIEVLEHFYTTDFFVPSAWNANVQIVSIYYLVHLKTDVAFPVQTEVQQLDASLYETEKARLAPLEHIDEQAVSLTIDKVVLKLLQERFCD